MSDPAPQTVPPAEGVPEPSKAAAERLHDIEAVTDAALAHLGIEDLLVELLDRVRDTLRADTAAVLLLDERSGHLVATAARGIEEEVRQGVRIPVGTGFAGRVAAERRPVAIEEIDHTKVANPLLIQKGIRSILGVPLLAGGEMLGVLHVGTLTRRVFTDDDVDLLRLVSDRVALAARVHMSEGERTAALVLQRSLLPDRLVPVPGLETAVRYIAGDGGAVGGDWYDVFALPSGRVCVTVGDVVGRGLHAAVVMGRLRSTVRSYALGRDSDPAVVLDLTDRKLTYFEPGAMATVVLAVFEPSFDRMYVSLAGHPAPILARPPEAGDGGEPGSGEPGGPAEYLTIPVDPPLGVNAAVRRRSTAVEVPPGAVACFYTDGLVERRGERIEDRLRVLCETVTAAPAEAVCAAVMSALVGAEVVGDDVALLALRRVDAVLAEPLELEVPAVASALSGVRAAVRRWLRGLDAAQEDVTDLMIAVGEAASNVVEHAYGPQGGTLTRGAVAAAETEAHGQGQGSTVVVTVRDRGRWRPPRGVDRGRGTHMMRSASDDVAVTRGPDGTEVVIRRRLRGGAAPASPAASPVGGAPA
jgi:serine phosphatase RsbU (regulator of sigma subunit)/anti-sigma regulatory factor (Ser/Thr protein kinase)